MSGIKNKIPGANLLGSPNVDLIRNMVFPAPLVTGSCSGGQLDWQTVGTTMVTIGFIDNELYIQGQARFILSSSNAMMVRVFRDGDTGDIIDSLTTPVVTTGQWITTTTIFNEPVGAHTYTWQIRNTLNPGETSCVYNTTFFNLLAEANADDMTAESKKTNGIIS